MKGKKMTPPAVPVELKGILWRMVEAGDIKVTGRNIWGGPIMELTEQGKAKADAMEENAADALQS
jgi:hypothetical protein